MPDNRPTTATPSSLAPVPLGLFTLSALVVANMVGSGVFTSSGFSLAALGNPSRVMLAWILCGVWAICGAIAYGGLVSRLPESGGEYLFLTRFAHPSIGFLAGWISLLAGFTAPISAAALSAAVYCFPASQDGATEIVLLATGIIIVTTACHLVGVRLGTWLQNSIVGVKLCLILLIVAWIFIWTRSTEWLGTALPDREPEIIPRDMQGWRVLLGSMSWVALSYTGFNAAIYVAGESQSAQRLVPRAMLLATLLVTVIYLALNYIFVFAPPPKAISGEAAVATIAVGSVGGPTLQWILQLTIILSMVSSVFAMLLAGPRVYQKMAEDGVMPSFFRGTAGAPQMAILTQAILSIIVLYIATLRDLLSYLGLTLSACGALAVLSLCWLRRILPTAVALRWWESVALTIYLGITALIIYASWFEHFNAFVAMIGTFVTGLLVYVAWIFLRPASTSNQNN